MKFLILILSLVLYVFASAVPLDSGRIILGDEQDEYLTVPEIVTKYGYPIEEHFVTTDDGYILRLHRIPHGRNSNTISDKVVFLQHGLLCSSADWIIIGVDHALAYLLADEGYDVWMGNARGNSLSRNHTSLNPDINRTEFWDFSWHEIGTIDLPKMIDYVLEVTGQSSLYHIGHSQGTTTFYVMTSTLPEYNAKIRAHISLAPIAYMNHMTSPLMHYISFFNGPLELLLGLIGVNEFLPHSEFLSLVADLLCGDDDFTQFLCTNSLFAICGFSPNEMNSTILPVLAGHTPAGSSTKQFLHYAQEIISGAFRQYDYGLGNLDKYGSLQPPDYDLDAIKAPMYLFYSSNDWMANPVDVERFCDEVGDDACLEKNLVSDSDFNHLDYLYGIHAPEVVYRKAIDIMNKH